MSARTVGSVGVVDPVHVCGQLDPAAARGVDEAEHVGADWCAAELACLPPPRSIMWLTPTTTSSKPSTSYAVWLTPARSGRWHSRNVCWSKSPSARMNTPMSRHVVRDPEAEPVDVEGHRRLPPLLRDVQRHVAQPKGAHRVPACIGAVPAGLVAGGVVRRHVRSGSPHVPEVRPTPNPVSSTVCAVTPSTFTARSAADPVDDFGESAVVSTPHTISRRVFPSSTAGGRVGSSMGRSSTTWPARDGHRSAGSRRVDRGRARGRGRTARTPRRRRRRRRRAPRAGRSRVPLLLTEVACSPGTLRSGPASQTDEATRSEVIFACDACGAERRRHGSRSRASSPSPRPAGRRRPEAQSRPADWQVRRRGRLALLEAHGVEAEPSATKSRNRRTRARVCLPGA